MKVSEYDFYASNVLKYESFINIIIIMLYISFTALVPLFVPCSNKSKNTLDFQNRERWKIVMTTVVHILTKTDTLVVRMCNKVSPYLQMLFAVWKYYYIKIKNFIQITSCTPEFLLLTAQTCLHSGSCSTQPLVFLVNSSNLSAFLW